jgi:dihydrodipicolinate synthase/N-acetylneuraminate lyase
MMSLYSVRDELLADNLVKHRGVSATAEFAAVLLARLGADGVAEAVGHLDPVTAVRLAELRAPEPEGEPS